MPEPRDPRSLIEAAEQLQLLATTPQPKSSYARLPSCKRHVSARSIRTSPTR